MISSEDGYSFESDWEGPSFQEIGRWLFSLGTSVEAKGGSVEGSFCGYPVLSVLGRSLDSQEQPTASVSAVSQEGTPQASQE